MGAVSSSLYKGPLRGRPEYGGNVPRLFQWFL
jgi:hypothetical protein